jgi:HEPN domain-containing protein
VVNLKPKTKNWLDIAQDDFEVAGYLFEKKKYLYCIFFCQQTIEKAIKAVYFEKYNKTPPRKHDLMALAGAVGILPELDEATKDFFDLLSQYYLESRYAEDRDAMVISCTGPLTKNLLNKAGELLTWLENKLK